MNRLLYILPLLLAFLVSTNADAKKKKYSNGDYYEGKMKKDQPNGFGKMYYANGNFYEGDWSNGVFNGQGKFIIKSSIITQDQIFVNANGGTIYEGIWQNGTIIEGKMDSQNYIYEGTFVDMEFLKGKMTYVNGAWINGTWKNGKIYNGDSYGNIGPGVFNGKWVNGKFMDGYCKTTIGNIYTGSIAGGVPITGYGKMVLNGNSYEGQWDDGKFAGKCKLKFADKAPLAISSFDGTIDMNGNLNGLAIYNNGDKYRGEIKNSQRNGKGVLELKRPTVTIDGEWLNNNLVAGKGCIVYSANDYSFTVENTQDKYNVKVKNPYNYQASFQLSNEMDLNDLLSEINTVVKSKLLLTEERLEKYRQAEDARLQSQLETYRNENYRIGEFLRKNWGQSYIRYVYDFEDVEYQYYMNGESRILHGKFHIWNGRRWTAGLYDSRGGSKYSVEGTFYKGIKNGKWMYEEYVENRLRRRLTINYTMGKKNGLCTLERFGRKEGSKGIIIAYYKNDAWDKNGTKYYYFNNEEEIYVYVADRNTVGIFDAEGEFKNTHTAVDNKFMDLAERSVSFDNNGKLHGDIYLREGDIELKESYEHGKLLKSEKRNLKKGITLSLKPGENRFKEMWKEILPATIPPKDRQDFLFELTDMGLHEESEYDGPYEP